MREKKTRIRNTACSGSALLAAALAVPLPTHAGTGLFLQIVPTSVTLGSINGNNNITITGPGAQVTYNIYANIEDDSSTPSTCYWELSELSITSTAQSPTTTQGTFAVNVTNSASGVVSYNPALESSAVSQPGYETDGWNCSLNPPTPESLVNSVGGTAPTNNNTGPGSDGGGQWINLSTGTNGFQNPHPVSDVTIAGITYSQINLGQFTWIASQTGTGQNSATIALRGRAQTTGTASSKEIERYVSDGTTELLSYGNALLTFGSSEVVVLPEPASLTLLGMALAALAVRARGLARLPGPE